MGRTAQRPLPEAMALDPLPPNTQAVVREGHDAVAYHIPIAPPDSSQPVLKTTIALPPRSRWTSGLHFHTSHTEYLRLTKGAIFVQLDGETMLLSAKAGGHVSFRQTSDLLKGGLEVEVRKYARHNWGRAQGNLGGSGLRMRGKQFIYPEDIDEEVIVEEWTDPSDIAKPLFFWNLNGVITASQKLPQSRRQTIAKWFLGIWWIPFQLFIIFWELDNWPIMFNLWYELGIVGPWTTSTPGKILTRTVEYLVTGTILLAASLLGKVLGIEAVTQERTPPALWEAYPNCGRSRKTRALEQHHQ